MIVVGQRTGLVWPGDVASLDELCTRETEAAAEYGVTLHYLPRLRITESKPRFYRYRAKRSRE